MEIRAVLRPLARLSRRLAGSRTRGEAIRDEHGLSVRQRAFAYFSQGLRPSQLPDMGAPRLTLYRYYEAWKHRADELGFRLAMRLVKAHPEMRARLARGLGVTPGKVEEALRGCRSAGQFRRRLKVERRPGVRREGDHGW